MPELKLFSVDPSGMILNASASVEGPAHGRPCSEVVAAEGSMGPHCSAECASSLWSTRGTRELERGNALGVLATMTCTRLGEHVVVAVRPLGGAVENPLTKRETQVLEHIASGCTNARIAKALGIRPSTVRTHIERLLEKLHAKSRAEAVTRGHSLGILGDT